MWVHIFHMDVANWEKLRRDPLQREEKLRFLLELVHVAFPKVL